MATCKDCIYYPACNYTMWCDLFKDKIDFVEVVRCWECKHCDPDNKHCDHPMGTTLPFSRKENDFCSYGERKDKSE